MSSRIPARTPPAYSRYVADPLPGRRYLPGCRYLGTPVTLPAMRGPVAKGLDRAPPHYGPPAQLMDPKRHPDSDRQPAPATRHHGSTLWPWEPARTTSLPTALPEMNDNFCCGPPTSCLRALPCCTFRVRILHGLRSWSQETTDSRQRQRETRAGLQRRPRVFIDHSSTCIWRVGS